MPKPILVVDAALLQDGAAIDEDESDAVALFFLEFLFAETNAYYQQHCAARRVVATLSNHLATDIVDSIFAAITQDEQTLPATRFHAEPTPTASPHDRHAVRSLPLKTPEKPSSERLRGERHGSASPQSSSSLSRDSHISSSSPDKTLGATTRTRRKAKKGGYLRLMDG